jgi:hypothetical protein
VHVGHTSLPAAQSPALTEHLVRLMRRQCGC